MEWGLQVGDRIVSIDGVGCHTMLTSELRQRLQVAHDAEDQIKLVVARDIEGAILQHDHYHRLPPEQRGSLETIDMMISEGPLATAWQAPGEVRRVTIIPSPSREVRFAVLAPGVVLGDDSLHDRVHVHTPKVDALEAGLREGDQIISINGVSMKGKTYDDVFFNILVHPYVVFPYPIF
jgi:C-terminal processing protease CtpA/Prc